MFLNYCLLHGMEMEGIIVYIFEYKCFELTMLCNFF
jgi:hypothetical protein